MRWAVIVCDFTQISTILYVCSPFHEYAQSEKLLLQNVALANIIKQYNGMAEYIEFVWNGATFEGDRDILLYFEFFACAVRESGAIWIIIGTDTP